MLMTYAEILHVTFIFLFRAFETNKINHGLLGVEDKDYRHQLRSDESEPASAKGI